MGSDHDTTLLILNKTQDFLERFFAGVTGSGGIADTEFTEVSLHLGMIDFGPIEAEHMHTLGGLQLESGKDHHAHIPCEWTYHLHKIAIVMVRNGQHLDLVLFGLVQQAFRIAFCIGVDCLPPI
uniref:Uncharacterized protein n=1 Tax=Candidatus Kentrum sp. TUN TaxID=2126343 RepID=A0A450ZH38_9GAMM|nr:MAG: hypothetical protein BECKTUN1418F_GA0071002_101010 [Candidatus Kentron sp. TUN]VFK53061.1 MAG: hypothetical protein BECKTUN1418E_GA0071001_10129 [Candidatus Kentron sp. TUN]